MKYYFGYKFITLVIGVFRKDVNRFCNTFMYKVIMSICFSYNFGYIKCRLKKSSPTESSVFMVALDFQTRFYMYIFYILLPPFTHFFHQIHRVGKSKATPKTLDSVGLLFFNLHFYHFGYILLIPPILGHFPITLYIMSSTFYFPHLFRCKTA